MKVLFAVGGSAGHVYPALAVLEELRDMVPDIEAFWIGRPGSVEEEIVSRDPGIRFIPFRSSGLPRFSPLRSIGTLSRLPLDVKRAVRVLEEIYPDVVLGMGSYASFAPGLAARILGIPLIIHEQNASLGLANRILSRFASKVLLSFPPASAEIPRRKVRVVGIPVRRKFAQVGGYVPRGYLLLLGGSLGSFTLVRGLAEAATALSKLPDFEVLVSAGKSGDPEEVQERFREAGVRARVLGWIDDMARAYAGARLVLSRAGASTVGEIMATGRPAILVPWARAAGGHQEKNAAFLHERGAAVALSEMDLGRKLAELIPELWDDAERLLSLSRNARSLFRPGAAREVAREILWAAEGLRWMVPAFT